MTKAREIKKEDVIVVPIEKDADGCYVFKQEYLVKGKSAYFFDSRTLIAKIDFFDDELIITLDTDIQCNLFFDVKANICVIKAKKCNLLLDAKFEIKEFLAIVANSAVILNAVCTDKVILDVKKYLTIGCLDESGEPDKTIFQAKSGEINTKYFINYGLLHLDNFAYRFHSFQQLGSYIANNSRYNGQKLRLTGDSTIVSAMMDVDRQTIEASVDASIEISDVVSRSKKLTFKGSTTTKEVFIKRSQYTTRQVRQAGTTTFCEKSSLTRSKKSTNHADGHHINGHIKFIDSPFSSYAKSIQIGPLGFVEVIKSPVVEKQPDVEKKPDEEDKSKKSKSKHEYVDDAHPKAILKNRSEEKSIIKKTILRLKIFITIYKNDIDPILYKKICYLIDKLNAKKQFSTIYSQLTDRNILILHEEIKYLFNKLIKAKIKDNKLDCEFKSLLKNIPYILNIKKLPRLKKQEVYIDNQGKFVAGEGTLAQLAHFAQTGGELIVKEGAKAIADVVDSDKESLITIGDDGELVASQSFIDGSLNGTVKSKTVALELFYSLSNARVAAGRIQAPAYVSQGSDIFSGLADIERLTIFNRFGFSGGTQRVKYLSAAESSYFTAQANKMFLTQLSSPGLVDFKDAQLIADPSGALYFHKDGKVTKTGNTIISGNTYYGGDVETKTTKKDGKTFIPQQHGEELTLGSTCKASGDSWILHSKHAASLGDISMRESLIGRGDVFHLAGSLSAGKLISLSYNQSISMLPCSSMHSKNIALTSAVVANFLGLISATQTYNVTALIYANLGLSFTNKASVKALFSFSGISLPNFSASPEHYLTLNNGLSILKTILCGFLPGYQGTINLVFTIPSIAQHFPQFCSTIANLASSKKPIELCDILPLIVSVKDTIDLGINVGTAIHSAVRDYVPAPPPKSQAQPKLEQPSEPRTRPERPPQSEASSASRLPSRPPATSKEIFLKRGKTVLQSLKDTALDMLGSSYNESALFSIGGLTLHRNISKLSFSNLDLMAHGFNRLQIRTIANCGRQWAPHFSLSALENYLLGYQGGSESFQYDVRHSIGEGDMQAHNAQMKGKTLDLTKIQLKLSGSSNVDMAETIGTADSLLQYQGLVHWLGDFNFSGTIHGARFSNGQRSIFSLETGSSHLGDLLEGVAYITGRKTDDGETTECSRLTFADGSVAELNGGHILTHEIGGTCSIKDGYLFAGALAPGGYVLTLSDMAGEIKIFDVSKEKKIIFDKRNIFRLGQWSGDGDINWNGLLWLKPEQQPTFTGRMDGQKTDDKDLYEYKLLPPEEKPKEEPKQAETPPPPVQEKPKKVEKTPEQIRDQKHIEAFDNMLRMHKHELECISALPDKKERKERIKNENKRLATALKKFNEDHPDPVLTDMDKRHSENLQKIPQADKKTIKAENKRYEQEKTTYFASIFEKSWASISAKKEDPKPVTQAVPVQETKPEEKKEEALANPAPEVQPEKQPEQPPEERYETILHPQHTLIIESAAPIALPPTMTGGDVHDLVGPYNEETGQFGRAPEVIMPADGDIELNNGRMSAEQLTLLPSASSLDRPHPRFTNYSFDIGLGGIHFPEHFRPVFYGDCRGHVAGDFIDFSRLGVSGSFNLLVDGMHDHHGYVTGLSEDGSDVFQVQADRGCLAGGSDIGFFAADYNYFDGDALKFITDADNPYQRGKGNVHLGVKSDATGKDTTGAVPWVLPAIGRLNPYISFSAPALEFVHGITRDNFQLRLQSTLGDLAVLADFVGVGSGLSLDSAKKIYANSKIDCGYFYKHAGEEFVNLGAEIVAVQIEGDASHILLITKNSEAAKAYTGPYAIGDSGVIYALYELKLKARTGDILNYGGLMGAGDYAELAAKEGEVAAIANITDFQGRYDIEKRCDPAVIAGGTGKDHGGTGLKIVSKTGRNVASHIGSREGANNQLDIREGMQQIAITHTYVSYDEHHHTGFLSSTKKHEIKTSTQVFRPVLGSVNGTTFIRSPEGGYTAVGAMHIGKFDADMRDAPKFYELIVDDQYYKSTEKWWGATHTSRDAIIQTAVPSLLPLADFNVYNSADPKWFCQGDAYMVGAYGYGPGDVKIWADTHTFGLPILNHSVRQTSSGLSILLPGMSNYNILGAPQNIFKALGTETAVYAKIWSLAASKHPLEYAAHSANLAYEMANTYHQVMSASFTDTLMQRYGLGSAENFDPTFRIGFYRTRTEMHFQMLGEGGLNKDGKVELHAREVVELWNGVRVHGEQGVEVYAKKLGGHAAKLRSSTDTEDERGSLGVTASGQVTDARVSDSHQHMESTRHVAAELSAGPDAVVRLRNSDGDGPMSELGLDGLNIFGGTPDILVEKTTVTSHQDKTTASSDAMSASTSGSLSYQHSEDKHKTAVDENNIIFTGVPDDTSDQPLDLGTVTGAGGSFISPPNHPIVMDDQREAAPSDSHHHSSIGVSLNVAALIDSLTPETPSSDASERPPVPIVGSVTYENDEVRLNIDVPAPHLFFQGVQAVYDRMQSLHVPEEMQAPQVVPVAEFPRADLSAVQEEHVQAVEVEQPPASSNVEVSAHTTDLQPFLDEFNQSAEQLDRHIAQLEAELGLATMASNPKPADDVTHAELKASEDHFREEHPLLYAWLNPEGDAASEFLETPPVMESIIRGLEHAPGDLENLGQHALAFLQDVGGVVGHYLTDEPLVAMQDNPAFPALRERLDRWGGYGYEMASFIGDYGAVGIYPSLIPASLYQAAAYRMDMRAKVVGNMLYHFFERPVENFTRLSVFGAATHYMPALGIKAGSSVYNTYQKLGLFSEPVVSTLVPEIVSFGRALTEHPSIQPHKLSRPFMRERDLYTHGYHHIYGTTAQDVVTTYDAIQKISDNIKFGWVSDFIFAETSKGRCPIFLPSGISVNGFEGWWTPSEKIRGMLVESPWKQAGYLKLPDTSTTLYIKDMRMASIAEVVAHEFGGHHAAYLFTGNKYVDPFITQAQKYEFNQALIRDARLSVPKTGIEAIPFDNPAAYLFRLPREYFNDVFWDGFSSPKWGISPQQIEYALKEAEFAFYNGQSERDVLVKLFSEWKVDPKVTESAYWVADAKRSAEYPAYFVSSEIHFPGEAGKFIPNTLPLYEEIFGNIHDYLQRKGFLNHELQKRSVSSSRFGLFARPAENVEIVIPSVPKMPPH